MVFEAFKARHHPHEHVEQHHLASVGCGQHPSGRPALPHVVHQPIKGMLVGGRKRPPVRGEASQLILNPCSPWRYTSAHSRCSTETTQFVYSHPEFESESARGGSDLRRNRTGALRERPSRWSRCQRPLELGLRRSLLQCGACRGSVPSEAMGGPDPPVRARTHPTPPK